MAVPYRLTGLSLSQHTPSNAALVRALQRDLRALGYLRSGIDGKFGTDTARAVRALQCDLLMNDGHSRQRDGDAPVAISSFNDDGRGGRIVRGPTEITGIVDETLAACVERLMDDARIPKLPCSADPAGDNQAAIEAIAKAKDAPAPPPFILAMVKQESGGRHFSVPHGEDEDTFISVGFDRNNKEVPDQVTSRGFGVGQYTLFHHPPRLNEVRDHLADPVRNVQKAFSELRTKFDGFIIGPADNADDRVAEHGRIPLRLCKYAPEDPRYLRDCSNCAVAARKVTITQGSLPYPGAAFSYEPTQYYTSADYPDIPDRADIPCDWPYAARRYNGSGINSFHYQTRILRNLATQPPIL